MKIEPGLADTTATEPQPLSLARYAPVNGFVQIVAYGSRAQIMLDVRIPETENIEEAMHTVERWACGLLAEESRRQTDWQADTDNVRRAAMQLLS